jgi:hypothetical protein
MNKKLDLIVILFSGANFSELRNRFPQPQIALNSSYFNWPARVTR